VTQSALGCPTGSGRTTRSSLLPRRPAQEAGRPKGSAPVGGHRKISDEARADIVEKYAAGTRIAALAREYGVVPASIRYALDKAGVQNPVA
jgi:transposase-like protein